MSSLENWDKMRDVATQNPGPSASRNDNVLRTLAAETRNRSRKRESESGSEGEKTPRAGTPRPERKKARLADVPENNPRTFGKYSLDQIAQSLTVGGG